MERMYFVAIVLPKELDEKILVWKRQLHERYGCKVGLKSPAHITLLPPFWLPEEEERAFTAQLQTVCSEVKPFRLRTNNFSSFGQRTLFVAVEESADLQALKKRVDAGFTGDSFKLKKESRPFHPHITNATRDLTKTAFAETWPQFQAKKFEEEFDANSLSLLKHNGRIWEVKFSAPFGKQQVDSGLREG